MSTSPSDDAVAPSPDALVPAPGNAQEPAAVGPAALKALAHPLRVRILDLLGTHQTLTASGLAQLVGESSGATSYHLRQLEKHGFVREVEGKGTARERWWERVPGGFAISGDVATDAGTAMAADLVNLEFERARQEKLVAFLRWAGKQDDEARERWRHSTTLATLNLHATPEELERVIDAWQRFEEEHIAPLLGRRDVPGAVATQIHFNAFPVVGPDNDA
ncbi:helix-turn-helix domain-containing protein [Xylanimonas oleitrophica]|uniref:helix-turn-helix domain-containing protein n=1 Tax=Xylanimonas oleitrophica TaxID=2607479 RepID=UPI001FE93F4B|nr:helix-turn-helix domain-containing protein [Xylanimonas oleitrophica]